LHLRSDVKVEPTARVSSGIPQSEITDYLKKSVKVARIGHSNLIAVTFSATDPALAAGVVNAVAENSAASDFPSDMPVWERAEFDVPKVALLSRAEVPVRPSSPNVPMVIIGTIAVSLCVATTTVLLRDFYARPPSRRGAV
jgi:uncharacterized protein involved in exopolysaccharide biosynthesis